MSEIWLSAEEVEELTALKRWSAQCRRLAQMGIPFLPNGVGRPLVERAVVVRASREDSRRSRPKTEPNWDAIRRGPKRT